MLTGRKEEHTREANKLQAHIEKLNLLADVDDPELGELILKAIQPPDEQPDPAASPTPAKSTVRRVNVTDEAIYGITQTFDPPFTINAVADVLAEQKGVTDPAEKKRLRGGVASMITKFVAQGRVIQVEPGKGKKQGTFRRVEVTAEVTEHQRTNGAEHTETASAGAV